ncbi:MAG: TlpA family protein disulfide reductase [Thermomicrobiales bacterium]|nr:TlpA family protein disulfide reductase [Thermomicrobiales bacterium]
MSTPDPDQLLDNDSTLADTDDPQDERGRIGYGANERKSSWILGAVLILIVLALGAYQWFGNRDDGGTNLRSVDTPAVGKPAPDFTLQTFDGGEITLSEQQGKVVILNFWGSWCEPCKEEMPALQAFWESSPDDVMLIGIGSKQDTDAKSRAFAEEFGITYPIGRDSEGDRVTTGTIAQSYTITFYPMTYIISPDGIVTRLIIGGVDEDDLETLVQEARDHASANAAAPMAIDNRRGIRTV